jgi:hypothetical protein
MERRRARGLDVMRRPQEHAQGAFFSSCAGLTRASMLRVGAHRFFK